MRADLVLTTGGISYGSGDTVREVLGALGTVRFDSVAAWPGHIMGVGTVGGDDERPGTPIVCLPGDPVSAQVCFEVFVRPALRHMQGWTTVNRPVVRAVIDRSWYSPRVAVNSCACASRVPRAPATTPPSWGPRPRCCSLRSRTPMRWPLSPRT